MRAPPAAAGRRSRQGQSPSRRSAAANANGVVWVALEEPLRDIPRHCPVRRPGLPPRLRGLYRALAGDGRGCASWRTVSTTPISLSCTRRTSASSTNPNRVQPDWSRIRRASSCTPTCRLKNPEISTSQSSASASDQHHPAVREDLGGCPSRAKMKVTYPNGLVHIIMTLTAPIDRPALAGHPVPCCAATAEADAPAENLNQVRPPGHARGHVPSWRPATTDVPLSMNGELHMPTDRPGLGRKCAACWRSWLAEHGEAECAGAGTDNRAAAARRRGPE